MFVNLFNQISLNYNISDECLIKKIESAMYDNKGVSEIKKLEEELEKTKKKLLHLIDLKLGDEENADIYSEKEKELKSKLTSLKEKIDSNKQFIENKKNTQARIDNIKEVLKETKSLKTFNKDIFEKIIEKIIIGEVKEDGTIDYDVIRFVLKTGDLAKFYKDKRKEECASFEHDERIY